MADSLVMVSLSGCLLLLQAESSYLIFSVSTGFARQD
jgi:hypothetical protein